MKHLKLYLFLVFICSVFKIKAQESDSYIEFNDRKNTLHGVYIGLSTYFGKMDSKDIYSVGLKVAYVANQEFEIGFGVVTFYSDLNLEKNSNSVNRDLIGSYGGLHLEPIFFGKSKLNLSFPVLIGGGAIVLLDGNVINDDIVINDDNWKAVFVVEPGMNVLYNISRYIQLEAGARYRFSSKVDLTPGYNLSRINGFSAGVGLKVGIFNMGRNRYKKKLKDEKE